MGWLQLQVRVLILIGIQQFFDQTTSTCGTGKTTSELQSPTSNTGIYENWDSSIWEFGTSTEYPNLIIFPRNLQNPSELGSVNNPRVISSALDLYNVRSNLNESFVLSEDIDLGVYPDWIPIGNSAIPFTGNFNGNGFVVHNLKSSSNTDNVGLFGVVNNANISDVGVNNGFVNGNGKVGGLIGFANNSTVSKVFFSGSVNGSSDVGGLIGLTNGGNVSESFSDAVVSGVNNTGGLIGKSVSTLFSNSYSLSSVSGVDDVGGFIGDFTGLSSTINFSYYYGNVSSSNVSESVGFLGSSNQNTACANNVFWNISSSSLNSNCDSSKRSLSNLKSGVSCGSAGNDDGSSDLFSSWNFSKWYFGDNSSLPVLRDAGREVEYSFSSIVFKYSDLIREHSDQSLTFYLGSVSASPVQDSSTGPYFVKTSYPVKYSLRNDFGVWNRSIIVNSSFSINGINDPLFLGLNRADGLPVTLNSDPGFIFIPVKSSSVVDWNLSTFSEHVSQSRYYGPVAGAPTFLDRYFGNLSSNESECCGIELVLNPTTFSSFIPNFDTRSYVDWCYFSNRCSSSSLVDLTNTPNVRLDVGSRSRYNVD